MTPPPAYFVAAPGDRPGMRAWLLGPYPDRPAAEAQLPRAATAPAGVSITTLYGA